MNSSRIYTMTSVNPRYDSGYKIMLISRNALSIGENRFLLR